METVPSRKCSEKECIIVVQIDGKKRGIFKMPINSEEKLSESFNNLMQIEGAAAVLIQPMKKGIELFVGAKKEDAFGHLILCYFLMFPCYF